MAVEKKSILDLAALDIPAGSDLILIRDRSDTTDGVNGTSKSITVDNLFGSISITESQISDLQDYLLITDLSVGAEGTASGNGSLAYDNTSGVFTYTPPTAAGIGAALTSHTHATSDITSGTFADARIAQSNVTQHLSIGAEGAASGNGSLTFNSGTGVFTYTPPTLAGLNGSINDLTDVTLTSAATNDILSWNGSAFVNTDAPTLDSLQFDLTAAETAGVGKLSWNSQDLTLDLGLDADVTLQIGQEQVVRVKANTAIRNGMGVYSGAPVGGSDNLTITPFSAAAGGVEELYFLGIATQEFDQNEVGFATTFGKVRGVNGNTYASGGIRDNADTTAWEVGDILYCSPNIAGALTSIIPIAPDRRMPVAIVLKAANSTNLTLFARAEHGYHLSEIHDIQISGTIANNELLAYDTTTSSWINQTAAEAGLVTSADISSLISLTELSIGSEGAASGDGSLAYDNTTGVFTYTPPTAAGIGAALTSHTHSTSDITSGTFADARIAQSNVTQHQAALSISASQIPSGSKTGNDSTLVTGTAGTNGNVITWDANGDAIDSGYPISTFVGGVNYQGTWNASTNSPTIPTASSTNKGFYYKVSNAGSTTIDGINEWKVGDWIISNGSTWDKVDNTESVTSVFGRTGAITASFSDITGTVTHEQGGLEADVSAYSGLVKISGGSTSYITDNSSNWDTAYGWGDHASAGYLTSETYTGTVTSVAASVPTGFTVSGSPITSSGTLAIGFDTGYSLPTNSSQTNWDTAYGWGDHASAGYLTDGSAFQSYNVNLNDIGELTPTKGNIIVGNGTSWVALGVGTDGQVVTADSAESTGIKWDTISAGGGSGTVTSVAASVPTGFTVSGSPITSSGTLAIGFDTGYSLPTNSSQTNWDTAYSWGDHASAGYLTSETYTGTVTSVTASVPTGFTITGSPITSSGTLGIGFDTGYSLPTTAKQTQWDNARYRAVGITIDGGGSAITTGVKGDIEVPYGCTIQRVTMLADQTGSIVVDIWKDTYANYPATDADSITASATPTISGAAKSQDSSLTGWTTNISSGDILRFNVDSCSTITRCHIVLQVLTT